MKLIPKKYFMFTLAAVLVVAMGFMAVSLHSKRVQKSTQPQTFEEEIQRITTQSDSDEIEQIEEDLLDTDFSDLDKELQDIQRELEQLD